MAARRKQNSKGALPVDIVYLSFLKRRKLSKSNLYFYRPRLYFENDVFLLKFSCTSTIDLVHDLHYIQIIKRPRLITKRSSKKVFTSKIISLHKIYDILDSSIVDVKYNFSRVQWKITYEGCPWPRLKKTNIRFVNLALQI